ncbi:MAG: hypothetical protein KBS64_05520 [Treponema sp.]|nr:hypothetical protein [Candidatus Treponema equi]
MVFKKITLLISAALFSAATLSAAGFKSDELLKNPDILADTVESGLADFSEQISHSITMGTTQQNIWADAYIGKVFPSPIPHFGGGVNLGATRVDSSGLAQAAGALGIGGLSDYYYYPMWTADVRVGGFILPFDLDFSFMKTGSLSLDTGKADLAVDLLTFGVDARYAILEGSLLMPKLSVGLGYFYNSGSFSLESPTGSIDMDYSMHTLYGSLQLSKSFIFCTPFVGLRGIVTMTECDYDWKAKGIYKESVETVVPGIKTSGSGSNDSDGFDFGGIQPQFFAGVGFNFLVFQTTLSVSADLRNVWDKGLWSGVLSIRAKL